MNKFQRKESRMIKRMHDDVDLIGMPFNFDHYKSFRRSIRKTTRMFLKANKEAHKKVLSNTKKNYIRQDLFYTIYLVKPIGSEK